MSKKTAIFIFSVLFFAGCGNSATQKQQTANTAKNGDESFVVSGHSQSQETNRPQNGAAQSSTVQKSETKTKWTQGGTPIDVSEFDAEIARVEKNLKAKSKDEQAKKFLAEAYLKRAVVLTDARQYASALGDYRRVLRHDAANEDAKTWIKKIIEIYDGLNKEAPNEGEEPPPLPFQNKG